MTATTLNIATGETDTSTQPVAVADNAVLSENSGYQQWLGWLQSLLPASGLVLYRLDTMASGKFSDQASLELLGCSPNSASRAQRYSVYAMRSASSDAVVNATSDTTPLRSLCCIPDVSAGKDRRFRHVLVVLRDTSSKLDEQTQVRLVVWAFGALSRFSSVDTVCTDTNTDTDSDTGIYVLSRWVSEQVQGARTAAISLTQILDRLVEITGSQRCLLASFQVKRGCVTKVNLLALSGQARLDKRLTATSALLSGIEQALVGKALPLDVIEENDVQPSMLAKSSIADTRNSCQRLIIPLNVVDVFYAVMLERTANQSLCTTGVKALRSDLHSALTVVNLADPRTRSIRAAFARTVHGVRENIQSSVPRSAMHAALLIALVVFVGYPAEHRISAPLNVEAAESHVLIAPVDGYVESVAVRAGDAVEQGQTLATLDDQDLQMQRQKRLSEAVQNKQAYDKALASHDRVEVSRLKESATLIETELKQLDMQQQRMTLKAPVDGVILSGSWDDSLGAAVTTGDTLFTLGSTSSHRLVLDVSEYDVGQVAYGQAIGIRLSADPSTVLEGTVTAIMPLAVVSEGVNSVQVHADLVTPVQLRPGMQGIGKIFTGRQIRIMQWFERIGARAVWLGWVLGVLK